MWAKTFETRLLAWNCLRSECRTLNTPQSICRIEEWWRQSPWTPFYLHWDSVETWPTPWEILDDNVYCPLTRALGMIYTIALVPLQTNARLIETRNGDHLVITDSKILNWDSSSLLNTDDIEVTRELSLDYFANKI